MIGLVLNGCSKIVNYLPLSNWVLNAVINCYFVFTLSRRLLFDY